MTDFILCYHIFGYHLTSHHVLQFFIDMEDNCGGSIP